MGEDATDLRALLRRLDEARDLLAELARRVRAASILEHEAEAASRAQALDRGRRERDDRGPGNDGELTVQRTQYTLGAGRCVGSFVPWLERDEEEARVRGRALREEAEAGDGGVRAHAGGGVEDGLHLAAYLVGPLQRRGRRQLDVHEEIALIFVGDESAGSLGGDAAREGTQRDEEAEPEDEPPREDAAHRDVAVATSVEGPIERIEEALEPALLLADDAGPEEQRAQRRAERERVERGDDDRDGDGQRELLVEAAGDTRDERDGDEHRGEHEGNGDDGRADLVHRLARCIEGRHPVLDVTLHRLDDEDGVVDDETDRQHEPEQRERVDREAEERKKAKVPTSETGTVRSGMSVARQFWRNRNTTTMTSANASPSVIKTSRIPSVTGSVVSSDVSYTTSFGKRALSSSIFAFAALPTASAFDPGVW